MSDAARHPLRARRLRRLSAAGLAVLLAGCAAGPDFVPPAAPADTRYTAAPTPRTIDVGSGQPVQRIRLEKRIAGQWWTLFHSPTLDELVSQSVAGNRTLAAARATLAAAQENAAAARGGYYPQLDLSASAQRSRSSQMRADSGSAASAARVGNVYSVGPTVSYAVDAFGATRRQVEQQQALAERQQYELAAAWLTLTGNSVGQALTIASLRAQIGATQDIVDGDARNLELVREKYRAGKAALTDVLTAQTQLAGDRAALPPLMQQLAAARHALAILVGRSPAGWSPPEFALSDFTLPADVPLSLPSALVRQRPDILAAEAQLHADSAAIGVAAARLYPQITLSAALGQQSPTAGSLFDAVNRFWNLAAGLSAPLFDGGTLQAQRRAAVDVYRASLATYEQTVLSAFQQVADSLQALQNDARLAADQRQLLDVATVSLQLQRESYAAGKSDVLSLISAQRAYQQARLGYARAQAQRLQDTAQLLVALGGGWWNTPDLPASPKPAATPATGVGTR